MCDGVKIIPWDDLNDVKIPHEMVDTTMDGEDVVAYKQIGNDFLDVRLDFGDILDLQHNCIMVLEYKVPYSHRDTFLMGEKHNNKPLFLFGFGESYENISTPPHVNNPSHCDVYTAIDAKWGVTGEWVTKRNYVYGGNTFPKIGAMVFSYAREHLTPCTEFPAIKNFYFTNSKEDLGGTPFFSENFDSYTLGEFYKEVINYNNTCSFVSGVTPILTSADTARFGKKRNLTFFRDFYPDSMRHNDGSGYMDPEIFHAIVVENDRDSIVLAGINIPAGCKQFTTSILTKKLKTDESPKFDSIKDMDLPIKVRFNTGEVVDLCDDHMTMIWTEFHGVVDVPDGATSCDLVLCSMPVSYSLDNIIFVPKNGDGVDNIVSDQFEINAYVDESGDIVVLNGELIATYNMKGQIASKDDKVVIIFVKNEEGAVASKVMVK